MGNDKNFVQPEDLPFRLIEIPIGSAPIEGKSSKKICKINTKFLNESINKIHIEGYDAPPSLVPPPNIPKRYDEPLFNTPSRTYHHQINRRHSTHKTKYHRKKNHKRKVTCCAIS